MTRAPSNLLAVRTLLLTHLNVDPDSTRSVDLEPAEVGIVGDPAHWGGYHCGSDRVTTNDYSVVESSRDKAGLTLDASALDVGPFSVTSGGRTHNLQTFSVWCVGQCAKGAPDTRDIREIIYSPDGETVRRYDALGRRTSGDDSHLWHTHFSFFRDAIKAGRDQRPLFRRYLTTIGLLEDQDMTGEEHAMLAAIHKALTALDGRNPIGEVYTRMALGEDHVIRAEGQEYVSAHPTLKSLGAQLTTLQAAVATGLKVDVDETALAREVLAVLTPESIAAAIPPTVAAQVADELAQRLAA